MVQGLKRKTFERKRKEADADYLEAERTMCVLVRLYGVIPMYKVMWDLANREGWQTYKITDEPDSYDGYPVFANRMTVIRFVATRGYECSFDIINEECSTCECVVGSNRCFEERHLNFERVRRRIFEEYERIKLLRGGNVK